MAVSGGELEIQLRSSGAGNVIKDLQGVIASLGSVEKAVSNMSIGNVLAPLTNLAPGNITKSINTARESVMNLAQAFREVARAQSELQELSTVKIVNETTNAVRDEGQAVEDTGKAIENTNIIVIEAQEAQKGLTQSAVQTRQAFSVMSGVVAMFCPQLSRAITIARGLSQALRLATQSARALMASFGVGVAITGLVALVQWINSVSESAKRTEESILSLVQALLRLGETQRGFERDAPVRGNQQDEKIAGLSDTQSAKAYLASLEKQKQAEQERLKLAREQLATLKEQEKAGKFPELQNLWKEFVKERGGKSSSFLDSIIQAGYSAMFLTKDSGVDFQKASLEKEFSKIYSQAIEEAREARKKEIQSLQVMVNDESSIKALDEMIAKTRERVGVLQGMDAEAQRLAQEQAEIAQRAQEEAQRVQNANLASSFLNQYYQDEGLKEFTKWLAGAGNDDLETALARANDQIEGVVDSLEQLKLTGDDTAGNIEGLNSALQEYSQRRQMVEEELERRGNGLFSESGNDTGAQDGGRLNTQTNSLTRMGGYVGGVNNISNFERYQSETAKSAKETASNTKSLYQFFRQQANSSSTSSAVFS